MREKLKSIKQTAQQAITEARDIESLKELQVKFLGRKGEITGVLRGLKDLPGNQRAEIGKAANLLKNELEIMVEEKMAQFNQLELERRLQKEQIDVTYPGRPFDAGRRHPLNLIMNEVKEIFIGMGFEIAEGPEVELDYYNFEALNVPPNIRLGICRILSILQDQQLLRTHTSPVQVRTMEKKRPHLPVRIIVPGKVYRRDDDATHSPMFHQVEGLVLDHHITFADLRGTLAEFAHGVFGDQLEVRFRPSFFPFTEPSAEMDISCVMCGGSGCRVCSHTGWLEILGAGMVHPRVLAVSGYNPEEVTGFAFGMGIERITMLKYEVNDLRMFFENDLRFLEQF